MKPCVLIVDDDEEIRTQMKWAIASEFSVEFADDRTSALRKFQEAKPEVVLLDLGLPPNPNDTTEGMATLAALQSIERTSKVIIVSGQSDRDNAIRAIGAGAYDFLCKPLDVNQLTTLLKRCIYVSGLERDYRGMVNSDVPNMFEGMLGASEGMKEVFNTVRKVAKSNAPVLILGESGTGKEMVANAIHRQSPRSKGAFVAINCNAIPDSLIESELFGYEKGSFTGANTQKIGLIETASGGTLFLDEIGDLPPPVQVKLLRFLQEKTIQRVGGRKEINVDTRVLAATHVDLKAAIKDGKFREDLYFRLAVVCCNLPPLRERDDDVLLLAKDFLRRFAVQDGKEGLGYDAKAERAIRSHHWPGNVRELQNCVQRAVIMADGKKIRPEDMQIESSEHGNDGDDGTGGNIRLAISTGAGLREARENLEKEMVVQALQLHEGNVSAAAKELGVSRPTLYELMSKLGISKP